MVGLAVALLVVILAIGVHYEALRLCSRLLERMPSRRRSGVALAIVGALLAHLADILIFAVAIAAMIRVGLGQVDPPPQDFLDVLEARVTAWAEGG